MQHTKASTVDQFESREEFIIHKACYLSINFAFNCIDIIYENDVENVDKCGIRR